MCYSAVGAEFSNIISGVRSQVIPCEICGGQRGTGTSFSPGTSVFPCQYHSTIAPHSSSSTRCSYQKDKGERSDNLPESKDLPEIGTWGRGAEGGHLIEDTFTQSSKG